MLLYVYCPYVVINADDFYGHDAFREAAIFLNERCSEKRYAIIGYDLLKTLSDYGTVNRGVCSLDTKGQLAAITERINISKKDGKIICEDGLQPKELSLDTKVSMNFWCFHPSFFDYTEKLFHQFLKDHGKEPKSEFFIPVVADRFIKDGGEVEIINTTASWFGVTYKEDAPAVKASLDQLISAGEYPSNLWGV